MITTAQAENALPPPGACKGCGAATPFRAKHTRHIDSYRGIIRVTEHDYLCPQCEQGVRG